jgi:hypothetical protein
LYKGYPAWNDAGQSLRELAKSLEGVFNDPIKGFGVISEYAIRRAAMATGIGREGTTFTRLDPALKQAQSAFEDGTRDLAGATDRLLRKHGRNIIEKQLATKRLADMMIDLFVLACVMSRVDSALRKDPQAAARELDIANAFAGQVRSRVRNTMAELDDNQDELVKALADHAFDRERYSWDTV